MRGIIATLVIFSGGAYADSLYLRNGRVVQGAYLGGSAREVRIDVNGSIQTFDLAQVQSISFDSNGNYTQPSPPPPPPGEAYGRAGNPAPQPSVPPQDAYRPPAYSAPGGAPSPAAYSGLTIPGDTPVTVRMIDAVDSETARLGQTFRASIDEPIMVNGQPVVQRGADVLVKLVEDRQGGKIEGRSALTLALVNIDINGQRVPVTSSDVKTESGSRGARSAGVIGGGAALGAIVGALAGGGKGAAIGATSGAAIGTGAQVLTKGPAVKIPSETRLTFRLQSPVQL